VPVSENQVHQEACVLYCQLADNDAFADFKVFNTPGKKPKAKKPKGSNSKKVTFETFEENLSKAKDFYNRQLYISAARLFEELYPLSMGTPYADTILFLFADCYYQNKDYEMAAFHYKEYANRYTGSPRAEEAHYYAIKSIAQLSPEYSLDQTETYYAIEEINVFIRNYPNSPHMAECNALLDEMREKLALKAFEVLKLYYNTENYKAAQISAQSFLKKYASSSYADDAYLILVKNNYEYASKSVDSKKLERFTACVDAFNSMKASYPYSRLLAEAQKIATDASVKIQKINNKTESKNSKKRDKNED
jgi:outer membrane protein assembly factor BamD